MHRTNVVSVLYVGASSLGLGLMRFHTLRNATRAHGRPAWCTHGIGGAATHMAARVRGAKPRGAKSTKGKRTWEMVRVGREWMADCVRLGPRGRKGKEAKSKNS
jgi:Na+(H+)/acetate symporter ActP